MLTVSFNGVFLTRVLIYSVKSLSNQNEHILDPLGFVVAAPIGFHPHLWQI